MGLVLIAQGCRHEAPTRVPTPQPQSERSRLDSAQATSRPDTATAPCSPRFEVVFGIGVVVDIRDGRLTIISPVQDTPAEAAGLKAGDVIVRIGDKSTDSMPMEEAVGRIRGEPSTHAKLMVLRTGWTEPRVFDVKRLALRRERLDGCASSTSTISGS